MAFRLRRHRGTSRPTQQAVSEPPQDGGVEDAPEMYVGTTIEPEEGAASRISNAGDVDPNFKRYGELGRPGGAGGYGGAGTK